MESQDETSCTTTYTLIIFGKGIKHSAQLCNKVIFQKWYCPNILSDRAYILIYSIAHTYIVDTVTPSGMGG